MIELRADDIVTRAMPPMELHQFSFYRFNYLCLRAHSVMQSLAIFTRCTFTWNRVSFLNNSKTKNIRWKQSQSTSTPLHCGQQLILLLQNVLPTKFAQFFFLSLPLPFYIHFQYSINFFSSHLHCNMQSVCVCEFDLIEPQPTTESAAAAAAKKKLDWWWKREKNANRL